MCEVCTLAARRDRTEPFWVIMCVLLQVEIVLAEGSADGESKKYAAAAVGVLVPLMTSCMIKQVRMRAVSAVATLI